MPVTANSDKLIHIAQSSRNSILLHVAKQWDKTYLMSGKYTYPIQMKIPM